MNLGLSMLVACRLCSSIAAQVINVIQHGLTVCISAHIPRVGAAAPDESRRDCDAGSSLAITAWLLCLVDGRLLPSVPPSQDGENEEGRRGEDPKILPSHHDGWWCPPKSGLQAVLPCSAGTFHPAVVLSRAWPVKNDQAAWD